MATPPAAEVEVARLLDTSAVSNSLKPRFAGVVAPYLQLPGSYAISFQTEGELGVWAASPTIDRSYAAQIRAFISDAPILYADEAVVAR